VVLLLGCASRSPMHGAVAVSSGLDHLDYEDVELLAEVHRLVGEVIKLAGGSVPAVGSPAWWSAGPMVRIASLLLLAESRLLDDDPHALAADQLKAVSLAISGALDWREFANRHVPRTELQRRRGELGPLYQHYAAGRVEWETSSKETAA
jgi:hypothetical protein